MNLYAWKRVFDDLTTIVYTTNETPSQGDQLYKSDGTPYADYEAITVSDADIALASTVNEYNTLHGEPYVDPYGDYIYVNGYTVYSFDPFEIGGQDYYIPLYRDASSDTQVETEKPLAKLTIQGKTYYIKDAEARQDILNKQDTLVSGTNIKTINNQSILGSGNIDIQGGTDLPDQTSQSGKFLTTDGTNLSWGTPQGGGSSYTAGGGLYIDNNEIGINKNTAFYNHLYINSKDDNIQDSDISFDENTFFTYTGGADNNFYNFIYMNGTWNLRVMDYSTDPWDWDYIGEVDLADYGITYNGTPFENGWFILAGNYLTGKTSFTVIMLSFSNVFLNGILLTEGLDFTRNDNTITFINYTLKATDRIQIL